MLRPRQPFQSFQEEAIHDLSRHSVGARFLFVPDHYGNDEEPADIAWACDDVVLLFYCTKNSRSYEKGVKHNKRQAKTWLNKWSDRQLLSGRNEHHEFNILRSAVTVIVISVVQCPDPGAQLHLEMMEKYARKGVVVIATISQTIFDDLSKLGASLGDFISLMRQLPCDGSKIDEAQVKDRFRNLHRETLAMIAATQLTQDSRSWMDYLLNSFLGIRAEMGEGGEEAARQRMAQVLADIGFSELAWLAATSYAAIHAIESVPIGQTGPRQIVASKTFGTRAHGVAVFPLVDASACLDARQLASARISGLTVVVALIPEIRTVMIMGPREAAATNISQEIQ